MEGTANNPFGIKAKRMKAVNSGSTIVVLHSQNKNSKLDREIFFIDQLQIEHIQRTRLRDVMNSTIEIDRIRERENKNLILRNSPPS